MVECLSLMSRDLTTSKGTCFPLFPRRIVTGTERGPVRAVQSVSFYGLA